MVKHYCDYCDKDTRWVPVRADDWAKGFHECLACGAKRPLEIEETEE